MSRHTHVTVVTRTNTSDMQRVIEGITVLRGKVQITRLTASLSAAVLFGMGFLTATWITALLGS